MDGRFERTERSWRGRNDEDYRDEREHRGERAWDRGFQDARYGEYPSGRPVSYGRDEHYGRGSQEERRQPRDHGYDPARYRDHGRDFYDARGRDGSGYSSGYSSGGDVPYAQGGPYGRDRADSWSGRREPEGERREQDRARWNDRYDDDRRWQQSRGRFSDEPRSDWNMHGREIPDYRDRGDDRNAGKAREYGDRQQYGSHQRYDDRDRRDEGGGSSRQRSSGPTWRDFERWSDDRVGDTRHSGLGYSRGDDFHDRFWSSGDRW